MTSNASTIFLLRHPQTEWNAISRYQGRIDTQLSNLGIRQAEEVESVVKPGEFDIVYSSPLLRACGLAKKIARKACSSLALDERLSEIAMGPWEGLTRSQIEAQFGDMLHEWHTRPDMVAFPGGETLHDVAQRVCVFMKERFSEDRPARVAVVSHDAVIKVAIMLALGLELRHLHSFRVGNASISVLKGHEYQGSVQCVNTFAHLTNSPFDLPS